MCKIKITHLLIFSLILSSLINLLWGSPTKAAMGEVVINEIAWMGTIDSTNAEWIELYNTTGADIDLTGWVLTATDGTPTINLVGTIPAGGYFLLERTSEDSVPGATADQIYTGALGNSGEQLELKDTSGGIIDNVNQSSGWTAGDNTTKQTMERVGEIWLSSVNPGGTPKIQNSQNEPTETPLHNGPGWTQPPATPASDDVQSGEVVINELVADPADGGQEWVELYNRSNRTINLSEFTLTDGSGAVTTLSNSLSTYEAGRYLVFYSPKGNLNNSGDTVILKNKANIIDQVTYGNWDDGNITDNASTVADPFSLGRSPDGLDNNHDISDFKKNIPTPGGSNSLTITETNNVGQEMTTSTTKDKIAINELYPNPPLSDLEQEFIEIINLSTAPVNLKNFFLRDNLSEFIIPDITLAAGAIKTFPRQETNLALDNDGETIKLVNANEQTIDSVTYKKPVPEGASWAQKANGNFDWTTTVTPGQTNIITEINKPPVIIWELPENFLPNLPLVFEASDSADPNGDAISFLWNFGDGFTANHSTPTHIYATAGKYELNLTVIDEQNNSSIKTKTISVGSTANSTNTNITNVAPLTAAVDAVKRLNSRTRVTVRGIIVSTPDIFNKDIFIAGSGLQLYLSTGNWPELEEGNEVEVTGTVSKTKSYGTRLLVKGEEDVKTIGTRDIPQPKEVALSDINVNYEGWLITVKGEISRKDKNSVTIAKADKILKIYFKYNDDQSNLTVGQQIIATGFLVINNGEFRLWPRYGQDINLVGGPPRVEGATDTVIQTNQSNYWGYLFIILAILIIVLGYIWEKKNWPKPQQLINKLFSK